MRKLSIEKIKEAVCKVFDTTERDIHSRNRQAHHAMARQFCYYYAMPGRSYVSVADYFDRHHGAVMHGVRKIEGLKKDDWLIKSYVSAIEEELER